MATKTQPTRRETATAWKIIRRSLRQLADSTATLHRTNRLIEGQASTIEVQKEGMVRQARVIELMAQDAELPKPPTIDKWCGSPSHYLN
jgi:hypothetical protein